jgi:fumarylacetoacetase
MSEYYSSHFGINNIPYGVASSKSRPEPQCVTRINDDVIFLTELAQQDLFQNISAPLETIFSQPTLNTFAALSKAVQSQVRAAIKQAYENGINSSLMEDISNVTMHLPVSIGDFTDYSASVNHVLNASEAITGTRSMPPAYHKYPVGYAGRCSSITVAGADIKRPLGQYVEDYTAKEKNIIFGPCRALDYEMEIGAIIGKPIEAGTLLDAKDADEHIFGLVLVNDWSARDIQGLEMNPLGPFNGKNFMTSITPWIIPLEALKPYEVPAPPRMQPVAPFMDDQNSVNYNIQLSGGLTRKGVRSTTCEVGFETMYWTFRHMIAHHTIGGCGLRTGDLVASGTVSGVEKHQHGCLMEMTWNGKKPCALSDGSEIRYLDDGDEVFYTGVIGDGTAGVGFGGCGGTVIPASVYSR